MVTSWMVAIAVTAAAAAAAGPGGGGAAADAAAALGVSDGRGMLLPAVDSAFCSAMHTCQESPPMCHAE